MTLGRRDFIGRLGLGAGAALLGPMLQPLVAEAQGAGPRKRFVIVTYRLGMLAEHVRAQGGFGPQLAPLDALKGDVTVIGPFHNPHGQHLHGNGQQFLTVMPGKGEGFRDPPGGVSFDRFLAQRIGKARPLPSICLSGVTKASSNVFTRTLSADGKNAPFPAEPDPVSSYKNIFGGFVPGMNAMSTAEVAGRLAERKSLLDFVRGDLQRAQQGLAAPERAKLEQYVASLRDMELQQESSSGAQSGCARPPAPAGNLDSGGKPLATDQLKMAALEGQLGVAAAALICGLTDVAAIYLPEAEAGHNTYHGQNEGKAGVLKNSLWITERVARLAGKLEAVPEGNGTLLDNALVTLASESGGSHHNGYNNHFLVTVGSLGRTIRTGRVIDLPPQTRCLSDFFVTVAQGMGFSDVTRFGDPAHAKGPMSLS
jgi:hypothetical protein